MLEPQWREKGNTQLQHVRSVRAKQGEEYLHRKATQGGVSRPKWGEVSFHAGDGPTQLTEV